MSELGKALDKQETGVKALLTQYSSEIENVLPSQIVSKRWIYLAREMLKKNPKLGTAAEANPSSFFRALMLCASLGHEPGDGHFHMIPVPNKRDGTWRIDGWEDYKGIVARILRSGKYQRVEAEVVYENDQFKWSPGKMTVPDHEIDYMNSRGAPKMSYAYAVHLDGSVSKVAIATPDHIARVRAESFKPDEPSSPWQKWPESMHLKPAVKILEKWVDASAEDKTVQQVQDEYVQVESPVRSIEAAPDDDIIDVTAYQEVPLESENQ